MSEKQRINVEVEGMEYHVDDTWTARGHILFHKSNRSLPWEASNKGEIVVKLPEEKWSGYPEDVKQQTRQHIKSALGYVNIPYSQSFDVTFK